MSQRHSTVFAMAMLLALLLWGVLNVHAGTSRDWAQIGPEPAQEETPTPDPSAEPPPVVCPTCPPLPSPHDAMMASESVYKCTVAEVVNLGPEGDWDYRVTCPVERYWTRGAPSSFYVPWSVWECGLVFRPGENWLIYANRGDRIDHCSRTAPFSDEEARELGEWCERAWMAVRPDRTAVTVGERFDVAIEYINAMPAPEEVSVGPSALVDVVSDGWGRSPGGRAGSWRCEQGNPCGHVTMVARRPGVLQIDAGAYTEVAECDKGTRSYVYGGVSGHAPPVVISPAALYAPLGLNAWSRDALSPAATAEPTSTATATPTATASPTPTATPTAVPTPDGSLFKVYGHVREGSESGPGLPGVAVKLWVQSYDMGTFVTDADGYYETGVHRFHHESFHVVPSKSGYHFVPEYVGGTHYGFGEQEFHLAAFLALPGEPTTTPAEDQAADFVNAIAIDPASGDKWFGTRRGVSRLMKDETLERYTTANGLAGDWVNAIAIDAATGDKWFGTTAGVSRMRADGAWRSFTTADGLAGNWVGAIAIDGISGDVWFGVYGGGVSRLRTDGTWQTFTAADGLASLYVTALAIDGTSGDLWFGTWAGVSRLGADGTWQTFTAADGLASVQVSALAIDGTSGDLWFGTTDGVSRLGTDGKWRTYTTANGLARDRVNAIAIDAATGDKWFATAAGVSRLSADGTWRTFTTTDGLATDVVTALAVDGITRDTWFGTNGGGVSRLGKDGQWRTYSLRPR